MVLSIITIHLSVHDLGLESMERIHINDLHKGKELQVTRRTNIHLLLLLVLVVHLAIELDSDASGHVVNTLAPDILVDGGVNSDILRAHGLLSELADHIHATRSSSLEGTTSD